MHARARHDRRALVVALQIPRLRQASDLAALIVRRRFFISFSRRGLSTHHRSSRLRFWAAGGLIIFWRRLERSETDQVCLRLRASHEGEKSTALPAHAGV